MRSAAAKASFSASVSTSGLIRLARSIVTGPALVPTPLKVVIMTSWPTMLGASTLICVLAAVFKRPALMVLSSSSAVQTLMVDFS